jgi:hypothetical protein
MSERQAKAEIRTLREQVRALSPVEPAGEGEIVYLLIPHPAPHDDAEICRLSVALGCNAVISGTAAHTYHAQALVAGLDLSRPVIWRHRRAPESPRALDPAELLARIEELERQIRSYPKL